MPSRLALFSAQNSVAMSGNNIAGIINANIPSVNYRLPMHEGMKRDRRTSPSPSRVLDNVGGEIRAYEAVDDEGQGNNGGNECSPFEGSHVGNDNLCEKLQASRAGMRRGSANG